MDSISKRQRRKPFRSRKELDGKVMVIEAPDYIDLDLANPLRSLLTDLLDQGHSHVVVDLSKTQYLDSSGLGALVSRIAAMRSLGGDLRLACASEKIESLLDLTNLNRIIKTFDSVASAISSFE